MQQLKTLIKASLAELYTEYKILRKHPDFLKSVQWKPSFILTNKDQDKFIAIDILLSGNIPYYQYKNIVSKLLEENKIHQTIVIIPEEKSDDICEIQDYCNHFGIGLKVFYYERGLESIIDTDIDTVLEGHELTLEEGWFPSAILEMARDLNKLSYCSEINSFTEEIQDIANDKEKALALVYSTIERLLNFHPSFDHNMEHFMNLSAFESLLKINDAKASDHVLHSFRVFFRVFIFISSQK